MSSQFKKEGNLFFRLNLIIFILFKILLITCNEVPPTSISSTSSGYQKKTKNEKIVSGKNFYSIKFAGSSDYDIELVEQHLYFKDLPEDFDNFKIGLIADFHAGYFKKKHLNIIRNGFYKNLLKKLKHKPDLKDIRKFFSKKKEKPVDILLFLGDLVNYHLDEITPLKSTWLKNLSKLTKYKLVFSIRGNHDYNSYVGGLFSRSPTISYNKQMKDFQVQKLKWHLLTNSHVILKKGNSKIKLAGIEHLSKCSSIPNQGDINKALEHRDVCYELVKSKIIKKYKTKYLNSDDRISKKVFSIIMAHDPSFSHELWNKHNIPLIFSGHTHGAPWMLDGIKGYSLSKLVCKNKYSSGLYKNFCGKKFLYVSKGVGLGGINIFGKQIIFKDRHKKERRPEVVIVTLHKKK